MAGENESKFFFFAHIINREFVGQKALNEDNETAMSGESIDEICDKLWSVAVQYIKREVLIDDHNFSWAVNEQPERADIEKFIVLQDQTGKKASVMIPQLNVEYMRKIRGKHVNVYVYTYGRGICNKSMHKEFSTKLLMPEKRDRANADSTVSLMEMVGQLKQIHSTHYSGNHSSWVMWANYIQCAAPSESRERLLNECPPVHLIALFRSVPFTENERMQSARNGLQITDNMIDGFKDHLKLLRDDFEVMKQSFLRAMELMEWRIKGMEDVVESNRRLVLAMTNTLQPQENEVSLRQESQIMDCDDIDHIN